MNDNQLNEVVANEAEKDTEVVHKAGRQSGLSSLQLASMLAASGFTPNTFLKNPFEVLDGPRTLSYAEAKKALKSSGADKAKQAAAQAKRDRKALKLKSNK